MSKHFEFSEKSDKKYEDVYNIDTNTMYDVQMISHTMKPNSDSDFIKRLSENIPITDKNNVRRDFIMRALKINIQDVDYSRSNILAVSYDKRVLENIMNTLLQFIKNNEEHKLKEFITNTIIVDGEYDEHIDSAKNIAMDLIIYRDSIRLLEIVPVLCKF